MDKLSRNWERCGSSVRELKLPLPVAIRKALLIKLGFAVFFGKLTGKSILKENSGKIAVDSRYS
jgi:hypothetical protein